MCTWSLADSRSCPRRRHVRATDQLLERHVAHSVNGAPVGTAVLDQDLNDESSPDTGVLVILCTAALRALLKTRSPVSAGSERANVGDGDDVYTNRPC